MQTIETGYKPEFGLGAFFSGQNAANAEALNQEELIKQFLANQQSRQMNPLDVQAKQLSLDPMKYDSQIAQAKMADPNYIPAMLRGNMGQMASQEAAGKNALALQPFKQRAEQGALENQADTQGFQWTINDLNKKISQGGDVDEQGNVVKATPGQMAFFKNKRDELTDMLADTSDYRQKDMLKDQQYAAQLAAVEARNAMARQLAEQRATAAAAQAENESKMLARLYREANDPNLSEEKRNIARATLEQYNIDKLARNPAAYASGLDVSSMANPENPLPKTQSPLEKMKAQQGVDVAVVVNNAEEWKALKPGTKYKTADGKTGVR